uniref:lipase member H isoform X1 n=1 Tax=Gasterosteus aculeatus aculeatus TaxID=481459 RepID=UPI0000E39F14|nr:lipase member H isoform X1 [Gasterosteus aculeatus aculeatus]XP_040036243.1 lipase member H isoform X1 [Gasterosteus aculeatus aculeatus]XP_040036244.1 lipase member H isoform X1 [Gasterosteus aculeatus aculeatus]
MFLWQYLTLLLLPITVQICKAQRCEEFTDLDLSHAIIGTSLKLRLLLYTRHNATCGTLVSHSDLSKHPQFNVSRPTTFVIHGFRPTGSPPAWIQNLTKLLLARADHNVIMVDWNHGAANVNYFKAVENTRKAAENLTAFVEMMKVFEHSLRPPMCVACHPTNGPNRPQERGASLGSVHMIGVSLGAHLSGFVGANMNGSIGRITALDPAGPQFTGSSPENRLDPSDAQFVDVLHTDMDALGFREPLGHIDFYPNGGADQPGCPKTVFSGGAYFKCDHQRSVWLLLDSLNRTCASRVYPCSSYKDFLSGDCLSCDRFGAAGCPVFGYDVTEWKDVLLRLGQTKTFFTTNAKSPFCMTGYRVEVMVWNKELRFGYITIKLHGKGEEAVATIDHKAAEFKKYSETRLLAQFDRDIQSVKKVSLKFSTGNPLKAKQKLSVLRIRLTHLERKERPLCRYDVVLQQNDEVTFKPIPCEDSNF